MATTSRGRRRSRAMPMRWPTLDGAPCPSCTLCTLQWTAALPPRDTIIARFLYVIARFRQTLPAPSCTLFLIIQVSWSNRVIMSLIPVRIRADGVGASQYRNSSITLALLWSLW